MTDECPDFNTTLRNLLATPPTPHKPLATPDGDDLDEPQEQDAASEGQEE
jgi:hypothetical protein